VITAAIWHIHYFFPLQGFQDNPGANARKGETGKKKRYILYLRHAAEGSVIGGINQPSTCNNISGSLFQLR